MRLEGKVAIVVGAGQTPGDPIANWRTPPLLFARDRARVLLVHPDLVSPRLTQPLHRAAGNLPALLHAAVAGDGWVPLVSFLRLLGNWGPCAGCDADIDGDGVVGIIDFLSLLAGWS